MPTAAGTDGQPDTRTGTGSGAAPKPACPRQQRPCPGAALAAGGCPQRALELPKPCPPVAPAPVERPGAPAPPTPRPRRRPRRESCSKLERWRRLLLTHLLSFPPQVGTAERRRGHRTPGEAQVTAALPQLSPSSPQALPKLSPSGSPGTRAVAPEGRGAAAGPAVRWRYRGTVATSRVCPVRWDRAPPPAGLPGLRFSGGKAPIPAALPPAQAAAGSCGERRARTGAQHGCCSEGI